jgi:ABC-type Co2+ transport system permease subunit
MLGLPPGSVLALAVIVALPLVAYGLYRVDRARGDGSVTIFGSRSTDAD